MEYGSIAFALSDGEWQAIERALRNDPKVAAQKLNGARRFLDAVLCIAMHQASWYHLPSRYGGAHAHYVRFVRWVRDGTLRTVVAALAGNEDKQMALEELRCFYADGGDTIDH